MMGPVRKIQVVVCEHFGVPLCDMVSQTRRNAHARHIAMYLVRQLTDKSLPQIGHLFGDRDHTTVLYGTRKVEAMTAANPAVAKEVESLRARAGRWLVAA